MIVVNIREKKTWRGRSELIKAKGSTVRHKPTTRKEEDDDGFVFAGMVERREPRNHTQEKKEEKGRREREKNIWFMLVFRYVVNITGWA